MNIPPLCILQMRSRSTRLPNKMLLTLGGESLAARAWRLACEAFGADNCVVAIPSTDLTMFAELVRIGAHIFEYAGDEADVLGRFHACAHAYRWHPDSVVFRWTADDPFKDPVACRRVAAGERLPVEIGGEAFTLAMLDAAHKRTPESVACDASGKPLPPGANIFGAPWLTNPMREHLTYVLFSHIPPSAPEGQVWTIDTQDDLDAARAIVEEQTATGRERNAWECVI